MRLAALQMEAKAELAANLARIEAAAVEAAERGAELLVAPELALPGYGAGERMRDLADTADGAQLAALAAIATRSGVALVAGFAERNGAALFNSAALVTPAGARHVYRKCHLYGAYERGLFTPGATAPQPVEVGGLKVGVLICYDVEFPEAVRGLALQGADLVAVPTALPQSEHATFIAERIVPVRAFENQLCVVYANHAGADALFRYAGRSGIALPDGTDAARAGASEAELLIADYDPATFAACRAATPYLTDRRADLF